MHEHLTRDRRRRWAKPHAGGLRLAAVIGALAAAAACTSERRADTDSPAVTASGGAIDTVELRVDGVPYALNDSTYALWTAASRRLAQLPEDRSSINPHVEHLRAIDREDVENTIRNLESDSDARRAISSAGIRVRDYVLATLALHQALSQLDTTGRPVRWENVPAANVEFARAHRDEIERLRVNKRFTVVDDHPDDPKEARELREKVRRRQARESRS